MILSARTLRDWTSPPRREVDEHVANCAVCAEPTPHARVIRRRPLLLIAAVGLGILCVTLAEQRVVWIALASVAIASWLMLRRRDRGRAAQCVRCLDRPRRENHIYLIDIFF